MLFLLLSGFCAEALAVKVSDNLDLGGAVRMRIDNDTSRGIHNVSLDTVMLRATYDSDSWIGAARYRFYGKEYPYQYVRRFGDIQFAEYAWIGYRFDPKRQWQIGLNQVPFGLQPYYSSTFYGTLGNILGLEDTWELGAKYIQDVDDWNLQFGYYAWTAWPGRGTSNGTTYSIVVTPADSGVAGGSQNDERGLAIARAARTFELGGWNGEAGISMMNSTLHNRDTHRNGRRVAYALHYAGIHGPWGVKLQYARQQMLPQNPSDNHSVSFGGYDGTFNVASRGNFYTGDLSYALPGTYVGGWMSGMKVYANYGLYDKSYSAFRNSQRFILGTSFSLKKLWIAVEWLNGRNDPYLGGSSYTQSAAARGTDSWKGQIYMNVGYYF
ncbi:hypothetical protein EO087_07095 [Dyella sp. M7H15-1]|uniref:hypothetical protein n=1 Tax=Dyella sp. M7H15-1 TaxID=2501295 RepID=UPI00100503B6|nr:hypothetical protein [Dyella sp. M7H15-1]QAU23777.1 hypothetical protein EO087_07095 [Dyella sp. M7H15-1]